MRALERSVVTVVFLITVVSWLIGCDAASPAARSTEPMATMTAAPLLSPSNGTTTQSFKSELHHLSIELPVQWQVVRASVPWTGHRLPTDAVSADLVHGGESGTRYLAIASQLLGQRDEDEWIAAIAKELASADACQQQREPIVVDGRSGLLIGHCPAYETTALFADAERGYLVHAYRVSTETFVDLLATVELGV
jgi:hypothetical protein